MESFKGVQEVIQVLEAFRNENNLFIIMELCEHGDLKQWVD